MLSYFIEPRHLEFLHLAFSLAIKSRFVPRGSSRKTLSRASDPDLPGAVHRSGDRHGRKVRARRVTYCGAAPA